MDRFIIFPSNYDGHPDDPPFLNLFPLVDRFESQRADGCQDEKLEVTGKN